MTENHKQSDNPPNELIQIRAEQGGHKNSGLVFSSCRISCDSFFPSPTDVFLFLLLLSQKMLRNGMAGRKRQGIGRIYM